MPIDGQTGQPANLHHYKEWDLIKFFPIGILPIWNLLRILPIGILPIVILPRILPIGIFAYSGFAYKDFTKDLPIGILPLGIFY